MKINPICLAFCALFYSDCNNAKLTLTHGLLGSSFYIDAVNSDSNPYSCNVNYTLHYQQYGSSGVQSYNRTFLVVPGWKGRVLTESTPWAASTLSYDYNSESCTQQSILPHTPGKPVVSYRCPNGLSYIGTAYGERESAGKGLFLMGRVDFPENFEIDYSYQQSTPVITSGGGASSSWDGISDIPQGINIQADGAHYW